MASLRELASTGELILSLFATQLKAQGVTLPQRQYVAAGSMIVWDGEQLTVCLMSLAQGMPGQGMSQSMVPQAVHYYATFAVTLVREITVMNTDGFADPQLPTAAQQDADGQASLADAAALVLAASEVHSAYSLTGVGEGFAVEGVQPLGPEGALAGQRLLLSVSVS